VTAAGQMKGKPDDVWGFELGRNISEEEMWALIAADEMDARRRDHGAIYPWDDGAFFEVIDGALLGALRAAKGAEEIARLIGEGARAGKARWLGAYVRGDIRFPPYVLQSARP
jgi:hypothetical protein